MSAHWHQEARELRQAGEKVSVIANRYGRTPQHVQRVISGVVCPIDHRQFSSPKNAAKAIAARIAASMWKPETDAFLIANYGPLTAAQIAERLGCSRNSVIGRAFRLGLSQAVQK